MLSTVGDDGDVLGGGIRRVGGGVGCDGGVVGLTEEIELASKAVDLCVGVGC